MDAGKIVLYGDDVLRGRATEIEEFNDEVRQLIERLYQAMVDCRGLGVAAPQLGVPKRVFAYDVGEGPHALVNPKITGARGEELGVEGCLSVPGLQGEVPRAATVTITGIDENGKKVKIKAEGMMARVFQHEMDHLDGTLFIDKADPETLETVPVGEAESEEDETEE